MGFVKSIEAHQSSNKHGIYEPGKMGNREDSYNKKSECME